MTYTFDSKYTNIGEFPSSFTDEEVKNEPMLFNCDYDHAVSFGGKITRDFMYSLPDEWCKDVVVDSRVHMLMKGWFPAIPGFHHDDVPRNTKNGQPNYANPEYHAEHLMGLVNGEICPTVFAVGRHELPILSENAIIYKEWHKVVENQIDKDILKREEASSGKIIHFTSETMHTAQRANNNGWRWFIRVSRNTDRIKNITNELRRQVQVYLEFPMEGW